MVNYRFINFLCHSNLKYLREIVFLYPNYVTFMRDVKKREAFLIELLKTEVHIRTQYGY